MQFVDPARDDTEHAREGMMAGIKNDWRDETLQRPSIVVVEPDARPTKLYGPDGEIIWVRPEKEFPAGFHGSNR